MRCLLIYFLIKECMQEFKMEKDFKLSTLEKLII